METGLSQALQAPTGVGIGYNTPALWVLQTPPAVPAPTADSGASPTPSWGFSKPYNGSACLRGSFVFSGFPRRGAGARKNG